MSLVVALAALVPATATSSAAGAPPPEPPRTGLPTAVPAGRWVGESTLGGVTNTMADGIPIEYTAAFDYRFSFLVDLAGEVTGSYEMTGDGLLVFGGGGELGDIVQQFNAAGEVFGGGADLAMVGTITRQGFARADGSLIPIDVTELDDELEMGLLGTVCEEAWGDLAPDFEAQNAELGLEADWTGIWFAVATDLDVDDRVAIVDTLLATVEEYQAASEAFRSGDPAAPGAFWDVLDRVQEQLNLLRNLGTCDQLLLGDDVVENWTNLLTSLVQGSIFRLLSDGERRPSGAELWALLQAGLATNALSGEAGSPELAEVITELLRTETELLFLEALVPEGDPLPGDRTCADPAGCVWATLDQSAALLMAHTMGWELPTLDGSTRSAQEAIASHGENVDASGERFRAEGEG